MTTTAQDREGRDVAWWLGPLTQADWLLNGASIRTKDARELWDDLDWSKAWVDLGPSPMGNPGPYWHVPRKSSDTIHRLYPKVLKTKWISVIRRAVTDYARKQASTPEPTNV